MIKAALFDMDGTIFDTERIYTEGWMEGARMYGYPLTEEMLVEFHGRSKEQNGEVFCRLFGPDAKYQEVRRIRRSYIEKTLAEKGVPVKPGLREIFSVLRERGILIGIATASLRERAERMWAETGITEYIDFSVCGDEVKACKPEPDIFLASAAQCGVLPSECLVFEDAANGIRAARRAGCHPVLIPDTEPVTDEMRELAEQIFPSLLDASQWIVDSEAEETGVRPLSPPGVNGDKETGG